jgi:multiple sugar transport system permease protein
MTVTATASRRPRGRRAEARVLAVLRWASIAFFVAITAFPLLYMVSLSFKDIGDVLADPGDVLPSWQDVTGFATYLEVLRPTGEGGQGFGRFIRNSLLVALGTVAVTLVTGTLAAYAAARLDFFGKRQISAAIILVYLFPAIVLAIPLFVMFSAIGLRTSLVGLATVYLAQTIPVALYMLRTYFLTVPEELEESAQVDGASRLATIRHITLPLAAPALAAVGMYVFMIAWNEFLFALLFLATDQDLWTLPLGLQQLQTAEVPSTVLMAGSVIISLPVVVLFFLAQRYLAEGLTAGAVKG